jgi:hypothetical protein
MSSITEQFSAATKSQLEAQFKIFNTFASTAVDSAQKVIALNISTAKQLLAAKDPSVPHQGNFDSLLAYGRELYSIASTAQSALLQNAQGTFKQVTDLAATKPTIAAVPPALSAAVSAAVAAANEPVASVPLAPAKAPKAKPAAAPIPAQEEFVEVKAAVKPSFPSPKPIALAPEGKPAKSAPKAKK